VPSSTAPGLWRAALELKRRHTMIRHWVSTILPGKDEEARAWAKEAAAAMLKRSPDCQARVFRVAVGNARQLHMTVELDDYAAIDRNIAAMHSVEGIVELAARRDGLFSEISSEILTDL